MPRFSEDLLKRMMEATGSQTLAEFGKKIGRSQGSISQWRMRGNIPKHAIEMAAAVSGRSVQWILTGQERRGAEGRRGRGVAEPRPVYLTNAAAEAVAERIKADVEGARWCLLLLKILAQADARSAEWISGNLIMFGRALGLAEVELCERALRRPARKKKGTGR